MYREPSSSSGSGASTKGDEVELVSKFLAPLCARNETARNIALAAARTTVEGWLGGVGSPNRWEDVGDIEDTKSGKFSSQDGRYDMSIERSPTRSSPRSVHQQQLLHDTFRTEGFFPQSINDNPPPFLKENNPECSFDCVDGRLLNERRFRERYAGCDGVESCRSGHSRLKRGAHTSAQRIMHEPARRFRRKNIQGPGRGAVGEVLFIVNKKQKSENAF
ncbi:uncharacterized protein [Temnothorax longispinosus]|uniref:uncharacterized protein isoform X1 n=1 Tax=Temnothorax longispinosus TaxID=300112 RepID=UPI003A98D10E